MTELTTAVISAAGAVVAAALGYVLTKRAERQASWRLEKLERYKAFVGSLSGILKGETTPVAQRAYARSANDLLLFAPQGVIEALHKYHDQISAKNKEKNERQHDAFLSDLLLLIRQDLHLRPRDQVDTFQARLIASGHPPDAQ